MADFATDPALTLSEQRARVRRQLGRLVATGYPQAGFATDHGGTGDIGASITSFEMLANADLSLLVKAGVQWGLFGGAVENLGTQRHHAMVPAIIDLRAPGCFAMTETGHGSDVQSLGTRATYDPDSGTFDLHTPDRASRKDYIGGAGHDAHWAVVFAQLETLGQEHGVHAFLIRIRDDDGGVLPGVTAVDCGVKAGLNGVDNGRLSFGHVRIDRDSLLNRYADVAADGTYSSPIENANRRFFTMLGTLIRGRVSVAGGAGAATRLALDVAIEYARRRRQFQAPGGSEVVLLDYLSHQRRLLPALARSYALAFAQNDLVSTLHDVQSSTEPDEHAQRELETRAAGIKALTTTHATRTIQECREACGGAGYMADNQLAMLKADTDVFTTFEGDNTVLLQLVAKELLTAYADEFSGLDTLGMVRFATRQFADVVIERTAARELIQSLVDARPGRSDDDSDLLDRGTQLGMFEDRETHVLDTLARRLRRARRDDTDAFAVYNAAQDHVLHAARVHVERVVLEAFVAAIDDCQDTAVCGLLDQVCDLYALSAVDADKAWFLEHGRLTAARSKAVTAAVNELCRALRPHAAALIAGFGIPAHWLTAAMLKD